MNDALLTIDNLVVAYRAARGLAKQAVSNVSFEVKRGECLGLVGESGCGKSSIARAVMQFIKPVSGRILLGNHNLTTLDAHQLRRLRPKFQMIFQDSVSSFNPRRTIGAAIAMPLRLLGIRSGAERINRACKMMEQVGLDPSCFGQRPHQLSGGQCQRAQIARALISQPELLICDEPVSSLDVLVQAQLINLLDKLRKDAHLSMLFISHDLSVVKNICDRVTVMFAGKICEVSDCGDLFQSPRHPYSTELLRSIPTFGKFKSEAMATGETMEAHSIDYPGQGCRYRRRCAGAEEQCFKEEPLLTRTNPHRYVACHYPLKLNTQADVRQPGCSAKVLEVVIEPPTSK